MKIKKFVKAGSLCGVVVLCLGSWGCNGDVGLILVPTEVSGGGRIDPTSSSSGSTRVAYGFNANNCDGPVTGHFTLVDNTVMPKVRLRADVDNVNKCVPGGDEGQDDCVPCELGDIRVDATYQSNNHTVRGTGTLVACLTDDGEGLGTEDIAFIHIFNGPFAGYEVEGPVLGNVQEAPCE